jgi:hypothetical protein
MLNMLYKTLVLLLCLIPHTVWSLERGNITSCAYQAGTAFEIQKIRQQQGHDWQQFETNVKAIYQDTQGRSDLLAIAKRVYFHTQETDADRIHDEIFDSCVQRQQGTEPQT